MMTWLRLTPLALLAACARTPEPPARASAPPAPVPSTASVPAAARAPAPAPPPAPRAEAPCRAPRSLQPLDPAAVAARAKSDPPADHGITPRDDPRTLTLDGRTFTLAEDQENRVVARDAAGKVLWRSTPEDVAGGTFRVYASPAGTFVTRVYSRGLTDVFRAADGRKVAEVGRDAVFAANDAFVLDPPAVEWGTSRFRTQDVVKRTLDRTPVSRVVARFPVPLDAPIDASFDAGAFGVDVCGASLYAISQPVGLEVRRAADDATLAAAADPGPGRPRFSRSGTVLYLIHGEDITRGFALIP